MWGGDTTWKLAGELPRVPDAEPTVRGLETLAVANRLDLAAAKGQLESTVRALGLEKTFRFIGVLDFGIAGETESDKMNRLGPSVRLELPIFHQGQARSARGEAQLRMAQRKFEALAVQIRSEVREHRDRLISKRDIARFYRDDLMPARQLVISQTLLNYNAMLVGAFELFSAKPWKPSAPSSKPAATTGPRARRWNARSAAHSKPRVGGHPARRCARLARTDCGAWERVSWRGRSFGQEARTGGRDAHPTGKTDPKSTALCDSTPTYHRRGRPIATSFTCSASGASIPAPRGRTRWK